MQTTIGVVATIGRQGTLVNCGVFMTDTTGIIESSRVDVDGVGSRVALTGHGRNVITMAGLATRNTAANNAVITTTIKHIPFRSIGGCHAQRPQAGRPGRIAGITRGTNAVAVDIVAFVVGTIITRRKALAEGKAIEE